jgi:hypothetical protein
MKKIQMTPNLMNRQKHQSDSASLDFSGPASGSPEFDAD